MSKENKSRRHIKGKIILILLVALLLLGGGFGIGLWGGGASGTGADQDADSPQQHVSPSPGESKSPEKTEVSQYTVTVYERAVSYDGRDYTLEELREALLSDYAGAEIYKLVDNHAVKSVYDEVKALLDELAIPYIEK